MASIGPPWLASPLDTSIWFMTLLYCTNVPGASSIPTATTTRTDKHSLFLKWPPPSHRRKRRTSSMENSVSMSQPPGWHHGVSVLWNEDNNAIDQQSRKRKGEDRKMSRIEHPEPILIFHRNAQSSSALQEHGETIIPKLIFGQHNTSLLLSQDKHDNSRKRSDSRVSRKYVYDIHSPRYVSKRGWVRPYSKKIFVFGKDDRMRIFPPLLRKFPYSNMVRLSTGCTGTLVTPLHVLTAAHCVHDGWEFRDKLEMLKVEVPDTMGIRVHYIEKIGIPGKWLYPTRRMYHRAAYDYAVVTLSYGVHGRSKFLPLTVPTSSVLHQNLLFLGFLNHGTGLWRSVCPARSNKAWRNGDLIITRCDSAVGNSGAAVLMRDPYKGNKIIGVLSGTGRYAPISYYKTPRSIITALTWNKLANICQEIGPLGVHHRVCPQLHEIPGVGKPQVDNRVIPFFG